MLQRHLRKREYGVVMKSIDPGVQLRGFSFSVPPPIGFVVLANLLLFYHWFLLWSIEITTLTSLGIMKIK